MSWKDIALEHAQKDSPQEACGLLTIYKGKEKYYPCKNIAEEQGDYFILDPDDWMKAEDEGEVIAVQDCWSLIHDWYEEKRNIKLKHWDRPKSPKEFSKNPLFEHGLPLTGFVELKDTVDLEEGDVLLMDTTNTGKLDHVALYLGNQTIFQHCVKRLSCRELYDQDHIDCTKKRYRYAQ